MSVTLQNQEVAEIDYVILQTMDEMNWDRDEEQELEAMEAAEEIDQMPYEEVTQRAENVDALVSTIMNPTTDQTDLTDVKLDAFQDRLDIAALYRILLNTPSFFNQGGSIKEDLIALVNKQLKAFVVGRLEILLGMKQDQSQQTAPAQVQIKPDVAEFLNSLTPGHIRQLRWELAPPVISTKRMLIAKLNPKAKTILDPIPVPAPAVQVETTIAPVSTESVASPVRTTPKKKVRAPKQPRVRQPKALTKEQLAKLPREDLARRLAAEAKVGQVGQGENVPISSNRKPMPTSEQERAKVIMETTSASTKQNANPMMAAVMNKVLANAQNREE